MNRMDKFIEEFRETTLENSRFYVQRYDTLTSAGVYFPYDIDIHKEILTHFETRLAQGLDVVYIDEARYARQELKAMRGKRGPRKAR